MTTTCNKRVDIQRLQSICLFKHNSENSGRHFVSCLSNYAVLERAHNMAIFFGLS